MLQATIIIIIITIIFFFFFFNIIIISVTGTLTAKRKQTGSMTT